MDSERQDRATPLEHVAPVYVEESHGYVDIQQVQGDHTLYTPEEARELAEEILAAAASAEDATSPRS